MFSSIFSGEPALLTRLLIHQGKCCKFYNYFIAVEAKRLKLVLFGFGAVSYKKAVLLSCRQQPPPCQSIFITL